MKKIFTAFYISATLFTCTPQPVNASPDHRATALVVVGALVASAGVYTLCKESNSTTHKIGRVIAGLTLIGLGGATILLSEDIVREYGPSPLQKKLKNLSQRVTNYFAQLSN